MKLISIIIPTLNEEAIIGKQLKYIKSLPGKFEIIICDGGSKDRTISIARTNKVKVLKCQPSRGKQQNGAAKKAKGDILLFLHADVKLPRNFYKLIVQKINRGYVGGGFYLRHEYNDWRMNIIRFLINIKVTIRGVRLGDHSIFVTKETFNKIKGFPNIKLMEDLEFTKKMKKAGKTCVVRAYVVSSARRYLREGFFKYYFKTGYYMFLYALGIPPRKLYKMYYKKSN